MPVNVCLDAYTTFPPSCGVCFKPSEYCCVDERHVALNVRSNASTPSVSGQRSVLGQPICRQIVCADESCPCESFDSSHGDRVLCYTCSRSAFEPVVDIGADSFLHCLNERLTTFSCNVDATSYLSRGQAVTTRLMHE